VYGRSDKNGAYPAENAVRPADLISTVYHLLGVGPEQTIQDLNGRPHYVTPGEVIRDLMI